ncbi:MAG: bifunctional DNA primase/polymerase, partial [Actinomycetota bacterium]|nr:bifunctional DNA primase/polymerase [Actinomycetota bacterium]
IDVRGDGGYIVVPPSTHASGARYRWTGRFPPASTPGWLLELVDRTRTPDIAAVEVPAVSLPADSREQRYAASALHRELARVASAVQGSRNDTVNRAAFNLGQLAAAGLLDRDQVAGELERVAIGNGLGPLETRRTIASGLAAGLQHPRTAPAPPPSNSRSVDTPVRRIGARRR